MTAYGIEQKVLMEDDFPLSVTSFPAGSTHLLISSALATAQAFYHPTARFFQERGYSVHTFDYRGIGGSRSGSLKGFTATMADWALRDQQGVMKWIHREHSPQRFFMLGHSLGGKLAGLTSGVKADAMVAVCTLSGYWRLQPDWEPYKVLFHTAVTFPVTCALLGYMPWSRFAKGCDLPRTAALQWAGWCRRPDYLFSDPTLPHHRYREFAAPVLACSVADDPWSTPRAVKALMSRYPKVEYRSLVPQDFGLTKLGHFGVFRSDSREIWHSFVDWFEASCS